ncbi:MAG: S8 family serine peptidase, partial [Phycisphaerae bacterium]|nr:S8 family serine peptidase [Phycisphaerae bacterium]
MSTISWFDRYRVREVWVLGLLAVGIAGASSIVSAAPLVCYVNNHAYPVERSETEFALELLSGDTPAAAAARFEMLGLGSVEALPWGPEDGRFAILRVARADAETRVRARECGLVKSVRRVYRFHADGLPHIGSGRLVVRLAEGIGEDALAALSADYGARLIQAVGGLGGTYVLEPLDPAIDEVELAAHMHQDPRTVYAHPDLISPMIKTQFEWDDEFFSPLKTEPLADLQWHLDNTGQEGGVLGADINIADAFTAGEYGEGVVVGMLDDACDVFHEDLLPNYTNVSHNTRTGAVSDTAANPVSEKERHGTAMMGLICAPLNSKGIAGVAPDARFTVSRGADDGLSASQIADAFDFAMQRGVDVHCNSWADEPGTPVLSVVCNAVEEAFTDGRDGFGMVVVFPTGNDGELFEPSAVLAGLTNNQGHKLVIGVGACNAHERVASYSNYGVGVVDVLAPSGDIFLPQIVTTDNTDENFPSAPGYNIGGVDDFGLENLSDSSYTQGDSFSEVSDRDFFGTSAACAQAAGVAALVMGASSVSEITATQVRAILEHTADQIPIADLEEGDYNGITRRSRKYGYGRVNA